MGCVFEAEHRFTRRTVAIKLLSAQSMHRESHRSRLVREAHALASVRHPGFVEVLDAGMSDELGPYVVLEMLEGRSLDGILASRQRLSIPTAVQIGRRICEALAFAHARGVVHRDIKPTNIFIARSDTGQETVKLLDLGIAQMDAAAAEFPGVKITHADELLGTPEYMAPEQIFGQAVDRRCDVYSTAITIFECLTGAVPYVGSYPQVLLQVGTASAPPSVREACPHVSPALAAVLERALAKEPEDRYATAGDFGRALAQAFPMEDQPLALISDASVAARESIHVTVSIPAEPISGVTRTVHPAAAPAVPPPLPARQRSHARAPYVTPAVVFDSNGAVLDARSEDISVGGILVTAARDLRLGEKLRIRFALPGTGAAAILQGVVRWTRPARGRTAMGIEFTDASPAIQFAIQSFIEASAIKVP
jgi:serine/threonine protein kinase